LYEVVEGLALCPFAARTRELGRLHRPIFRVDADTPDAATAASALRDVATSHADAEVVLLTFVLPSDHPWHEPDAFMAFMDRVRVRYESRGGPPFYMVAFHPHPADLADPRARAQPAGLVPWLRRTPDPVIQCVRADVLDAVRRRAQPALAERMRGQLGTLDARLAAMASHAVSAGWDLSTEITEANWARHGAGPEREDLDRRIAGILRQRDELYGRDL
jgi:hypothetical protein